MSEPIFRAWDSKNKCWFKRFSLDSEGNVSSWDEIQSWYDGLTQIAYNKCTFYSVDAVLCRSTGLKDMNGDLIFTNDIVKFEHETGYKESEIDIVHVKEDPMLNIAYYFNDDSCDECEIIGNIFEKPELLDQKQ